MSWRFRVANRLLVRSMAKTDDEKKDYATVRVLADLALKINIIVKAEGSNVGDYVSQLLIEQTTIEEDYAKALRKLSEKRKKP